MSWSELKKFKKIGKKYVPCLALAALMTLTTGFTAENVHQVRILVDGHAIETHTASVEPEQILDYAGVRLGEQDEFYSKQLDEKKSELETQRNNLNELYTECASRRNNNEEGDRRSCQIRR